MRERPAPGQARCGPRRDRRHVDVVSAPAQRRHELAVRCRDDDDGVDGRACGGRRSPMGRAAAGRRADAPRLVAYRFLHLCGTVPARRRRAGARHAPRDPRRRGRRVRHGGRAAADLGALAIPGLFHRQQRHPRSEPHDRLVRVRAKDFLQRGAVVASGPLVQRFDRPDLCPAAAAVVRRVEGPRTDSILRRGRRQCVRIDSPADRGYGVPVRSPASLLSVCTPVAIVGLID